MWLVIRILRSDADLTWCNCQQLLLDSVDEILDVGSRSTPEYKTVSGVYIARLNCWMVYPEQDWVDADSRETCIEHLRFLLGIPRCSMESVPPLDLGLHLELAVHITTALCLIILDHLRRPRSMLDMDC